MLGRIFFLGSVEKYLSNSSSTGGNRKHAAHAKTYQELEGNDDAQGTFEQVVNSPSYAK